MRNGGLLPGREMPVLGPPEPHPNPMVQAMRDAWNLKIIAWGAVWDQRPKWLARRNAGHWRHPEAPRRVPVLIEQTGEDAEAENC